MKTATPQIFLYRGFLIRPGLIGDWFISKEGVRLSCARSTSEAKTIVDELIAGHSRDSWTASQMAKVVCLENERKARVGS